MIKKLFPWNRLTKHLIVLVFLSIVSLAYFWKVEVLLVLVALAIPVIHRIEKDYQGKRSKCPRCRRWKCSHKFDTTLCITCVDAEIIAEERRRDLARTLAREASSFFPGKDKMPPKPRISPPMAQASFMLRL